MDWNYPGLVTGHVSFNANAKTGGSLDHQNSSGDWLHGVVDNYASTHRAHWTPGRTRRAFAFSDAAKIWSWNR